MKRRTVLFGASGLLGSGLLRELQRAGDGSVLTLAWSEAGPAFAAGSASLREWLEKRVAPFAANAEQVTLIFANGITNPKLPAAEIRASNVEFPMAVVEELKGRPEFRFLTIGTIFENFPQACESNPYLGSKLALGRWMGERSAREGGRFLHVRLHTVYGPALQPHMFLGQMAQAIATRSAFPMSSGEQMREYHHVDDVVAAFCALLERDWRSLGKPVEISSGHPVRLADVAREVFHQFGMENLLQIGAIPGAPADNKEKTFARSPEWLLLRSRPAIQGIVDSIRESVEKKR